MATATVTSKGQITIPVEIRERYGIETGASLVFVPVDGNRFEIYPKTGSIMELAGMFAHDGPPVTVDEMNEAIAEHLGEKHGR